MWYVWFPLACAISASEEYTVIGLDIDESKIEKIARKVSPVEDERASEDILKFPFEATTNAACLEDADIALVCVPTPVSHDYIPNLWPVLSAITSIAKYAKKPLDIIIESTINPGVCNEVIAPKLSELWKELNKDYFLGHCPERINPGDPVWNVYNIPRNVWWSTTDTTTRMADFYRSFLHADVREMKDIKHAEATKIVENVFRDVNIAFVNELAKSFDALWLDIVEVIQWSSNKPFAFMAHYPWCWVGGHCIPVDPYYLIERAKQQWFDHKYLSLAREINNSMPDYTVELLIKELNKKKKSLNWTKVWLLGMSYKRDISDLRESPSFEILDILKEYWAEVEIFEPFDTSISTQKSLEDTLHIVDTLVVATNHSWFVTSLTWNLLEKNWISIVVDGKNCLNKDDLLSHNIAYKWIGR